MIENAHSSYILFYWTETLIQILIRLDLDLYLFFQGVGSWFMLVIRIQTPFDIFCSETFLQYLLTKVNIELECLKYLYNLN